MDHKCSQCDGLGKVGMLLPIFANLEEQIKAGYETRVRPCDVCGGTGQVSLERQFYTHNPQQSFNNFESVMRQNGPPTQIYVPKDLSEEVWMRFATGKQFVFGACAIGYKGDRPRNFLTFLRRVGYEITLDDIAEMRAPVILKRGLGPPKVTRGTGKTLLEAREDALSRLPGGVEIVAEKVIKGGSPLFAESSAPSLDAARASAKSALPNDAAVEGEEILSEPSQQQVCVRALSFESAMRKLKQRFPRAELSHPSVRGVFLLKKFSFSVSFPATIRLKYSQPSTIQVTYLCRV